MECMCCGSAAVTERRDRIAQGYRRFRCRDCGRQFNERSAGGAEPDPVSERRDRAGGALAEVIHRRGPWRAIEAVEFATLEWVDWFNHRRLLEPIGNIPPAEAEDRYYAMLEQTAMAA